MSGPPDVDHLIASVGLPPATLRRGDVERRVGMSHEDLVRWWRAMGFAEVPEEDLAFGEDDVNMAGSLAGLLASGRVEDRDVLRLARVLGASFSRIAEAQVDLFDREAIGVDEEPDASTGQDPDPVLTVDPELLHAFEESLVYVWRRHLLAAVGRRVRLGALGAPPLSPDAAADDRDPASEPLAGDDHSPGAMTIGFVDITGFSKMSKRMSSNDLAALVDRFEADALDVVGSHGGRVVKFIGDAVMYVATDLLTGVEIGLDLQERGASTDPPVELHCGVAHGPGVTVGGDVFGPTVNLASRLTDIARKGTVVIPRSDVAALEDLDAIVVRPVRRSYDLRGIGRTRVATVLRSAEATVEHSDDAGRRDLERSERRERKERERNDRRERRERERDAHDERERDARDETPHLDRATDDGPDSS